MPRYKVCADVNGHVEPLEWINGEIIAEPYSTARFRHLMVERGADVEDRKAAEAVMLGHELFAKPSTGSVMSGKQRLSLSSRLLIGTRTRKQIEKIESL